MDKIYRFLFDRQTGQYLGITREMPWADNTTDIPPFFQIDFKTVFDRDLNEWKLVKDESFFQTVSVQDKIKEVDLFCIEKLDVVADRIIFLEDEINNKSDDIITDIEQLSLDCRNNFINANKNVLNSEQQILKIQTANYHALEQQIRRLSGDVQLIMSLQNRIGLQLVEIDREVKKQYWFSRVVNYFVNLYYAILRGQR